VVTPYLPFSCPSLWPFGGRVPTTRLGKLFEHNVTLGSSGSFTKHYQFGGKLIAMREGLSSGSSVSFFATDHLGSTAATIWANGSVRSQLRYDAWGKQRYAQHTTPTGYRLTHQPALGQRPGNV
jgi:hypothetical protein